jgi:stage II sporulation protein D
LTVDGMGSGHGVGFCQWGAVGRARAGQGYEQILAAYFPGTRLERRY